MVLCCGEAVWRCKVLTRLSESQNCFETKCGQTGVGSLFDVRVSLSTYSAEKSLSKLKSPISFKLLLF